MKEKRIRILKVEPHKPPAVCELENELQSLQEAVSIGAEHTGLIEIINLDEKTCILCNEEGKLIGLKPNRRLGRDVIVGVFYITGQDDEGNLTSLSENDIESYSKQFAVPEVLNSDDIEKAMTFNVFVY